MKYEEMSNREVNVRMVELCGYKLNKHQTNMVADLRKEGNGRDDGVVFIFDKFECTAINFCVSGALLMQMALDHKLKIEWLNDEDGEYCNVKSPCDSVFSDDENPSRAISICLLKMKDAEVK